MKVMTSLQVTNLLEKMPNAKVFIQDEEGRIIPVVHVHFKQGQVSGKGGGEPEYNPDSEDKILIQVERKR